MVSKSVLNQMLITARFVFGSDNIVFRIKCIVFCLIIVTGDTIGVYKGINEVLCKTAE